MKNYKIKSEIELHTHPYFKAYGLEEVVQAMEKNKLNVIALEYLDGAAFSDVKTEGDKLSKSNKGYIVDSDNLAVRIEKDEKQFYILKAAELSTEDKNTGYGFHIITIGADSSTIKPFQPIRNMIDCALEQGASVIFDHPFANKDNFRKKVSKSAEEEIIKVCKEYSGQIALEWNGYCISWLRKLLFGGDVNEDIIKLSQELAYESCNNPVVTDTDDHARNTNALKAIGTGRIKSYIDLTSGRRIINSLNKNIFSGRYENTYETVSLPHFVKYFGIPYIFRRFIERPRG